MNNNVTYLNKSYSRSTEDLLGTRATFVTAGGIFSGTISAVEQNFVYELQDVTFRPTGQLQIQFKMKICEIYCSNIIASLPEIEPLKLNL